MNIPFLHKLPGLVRRPLHRIVSTGSADSAAAEAALQHLLGELPELLMAAVLAVGSGQVLASYTSQPQLWPGEAASYWLATVHQLHTAQAAQGQSQEQVAEVLTTLPSQLHLLRLQPQGQYLLCLAVEARDTNLALAREVMRQAIDLMTVI